MNYINIIGRLENIDLVIKKYILKYDIQLEEASKEYKKFKNYIINNKYTDYFRKIKKFVNISNVECTISENISEEKAIEIIDKVNKFFKQRDRDIKILEDRKNNLEEILKKLKYYTKLDFDVSDIKKFNFIKFNFGKMPIDNFKQFKLYLYNNINIIFVESMRDEKSIYCIYFCTKSDHDDKIKTLLKSLNFETVYLPFEFDNIKFNGSPMKIYKYLENILEKEKLNIENLYKKTLLESKVSEKDILNAYNKIKNLYLNYDIKKYAAKISDNFFIFVGWISENEAKKINEEVINDNKVLIKIEDDKKSSVSKPPTKLKNLFLFRPFEFFVKTYSIPQYNEIDPTPFLAITYTLIFGMMFGDLGQGFIISILGFILYKYKKIESSLIMVIVGFSSMIFGILYGSVFGFEDIIPALWLKPFENINSILISTIFLGIVLTILSMILNIINALKEKNKIRLFLSSNGIIGITLYVGSISSIVAFLFKNIIITKILLVIFVLIPIILMAFRRFIIKKIDSNKENIGDSKILSLLESFIELFEILLTYFTNTLSFIRIGAFALSHAGMMNVILLLSKNEMGNYNLFVVIIGNILVIFVEAVIVSIQVLRMQFYEMFSRYYVGEGREFKPYNKKIKDKIIDI